MIRCKFCQLAACTCGREDWEDYMTGGEAKYALVDANVKIEQLQAECDELAAQVAVLRDALNKLTQRNSSNETISVQTRYVTEGRAALSTTPPAALAALRAKHLEEAANVAEDYNGKRGEHDGTAIGHAIRALINKEPT